MNNLSQEENKTYEKFKAIETYILTKDYNSAINELLEVIQQYPQLVSAKTNLAFCYYMTACWNELQSVCQEIISMGLSNGDVHNMLAVSYFNLFEYTLARQEIKKAINLEPFNPVFKENLKKFDGLAPIKQVQRGYNIY